MAWVSPDGIEKERAAAGWPRPCCSCLMVWLATDSLLREINLIGLRAWISAGVWLPGNKGFNGVTCIDACRRCQTGAFVWSTTGSIMAISERLEIIVIFNPPPVHHNGNCQFRTGTGGGYSQHGGRGLRTLLTPVVLIVPPFRPGWQPPCNIGLRLPPR